MAKKPTKWTLESLLDFEHACYSGASSSPNVRSLVVAATRGLAGSAARRVGLKIWLAEIGKPSAGEKFTGALSLASVGLLLMMLLGGASTVIGLLDRERGGIHVTLFLAILIGGQWLVLLLALVAWLMRRKAADGFSGIQSLLAKLIRRLAGASDEAWWDHLMEAGGAARAAILWRLAAIAQLAGVSFNLGILCGLAGLVLVKHVGFFWETTTDFAMRSVLGRAVNLLSTPWSAWWPGTVPCEATLDASRWVPGQSSSLTQGQAEWWQFLLLTTLVWGLLPRLILLILSKFAERKAMANLDFQGRHHRALWREITGINREETGEKPMDGVLVLDVGGTGLSEHDLRPFLLQQLRVYPAAWKSVAVLDQGAEHAAAQSLTAAPAGVVLLAEGWSLSPVRMAFLLQKVRACAGPEVPVKFLVANVTTDKQPTQVTSDEQFEWTRFVDGLRDPAAEVFFFEPTHLPL